VCGDHGFYEWSLRRSHFGTRSFDDERDTVVLGVPESAKARVVGRALRRIGILLTGCATFPDRG